MFYSRKDPLSTVYILHPSLNLSLKTLYTTYVADEVIIKPQISMIFSLWKWNVLCPASFGPSPLPHPPHRWYHSGISVIHNMTCKSMKVLLIKGLQWRLMLPCEQSCYFPVGKIEASSSKKTRLWNRGFSVVQLEYFSAKNFCGFTR